MLLDKCFRNSNRSQDSRSFPILLSRFLLQKPIEFAVPYKDSNITMNYIFPAQLIRDAVFSRNVHLWLNGFLCLNQFSWLRHPEPEITCSIWQAENSAYSGISFNSFFILGSLGRDNVKWLYSTIFLVCFCLATLMIVPCVLEEVYCAFVALYSFPFALCIRLSPRYTYDTLWFLVHPPSYGP